MEITQSVNYSKYLVSAYSKKSVSQAEKGNEVKEVSEEEKLAEFKKEICF